MATATRSARSAGPARRGLRVAAAVVSGVVLATSGVAWAGVNRYAGQVTKIDIPGLSLASGGSSDPMTLLVVASDSRAGLSRRQTAQLHLGSADYGNPRTDTMMLVHIGAGGEHISVVSLPRDTLATVPAYTDATGKKHKAQQAKLNAAYELGGAALMVTTVQNMTGVSIQHYLEINFSGFLQMVDALDGVEVCLAKALKDEKSGLDLPAGRQVIDGPQSLAYVRARYVDPSADLGRMKRQQAFVASMVKKATSAGTLLNTLKLDDFLSAVAGSVATDSGLDRTALLDLADRVKGVNPGSVAFTTVPLSGDKRVSGLGLVLVWDAAAAKAMFDAINADQPLVTPTPAPAARAITVAPGKVTLKVLNGSTTAGLGRTAADDLAAVGFAISGSATNAPEPVGESSVIRFDPRYDASAQTVAAALPGATLSAVKGFGRTIEVTVGSAYAGATKVTVTTTAPSTTTTTGQKARTAADDLCA